MSLLVDQIIYTSFPKLGFKSLVSQQVPLEIEQAFLQHIVHQHWDAYNPPAANYRAAYLHQLSPRQTLFGWLYNDGKDDIGRSHTPYFLSYYLAEKLEKVQLEYILTCLETGPLTSLERQQIPTAPHRLTLPASGSYQPSRPGVRIPKSLQQQSYRQLQQQQLLQLFVPQVGVEREIFANQPVQLSVAAKAASVPSLRVSVGQQENNLVPSQNLAVKQNGNKEGNKERDKTKIKDILGELAAKSLGIHGIALVSPEGQPIVAPLGLDERSVLLLAEKMLALLENTETELNWQEIKQIAIRARQGHLIFTCCYPDFFLLVKAGKVPIGLLEGEINRTTAKLREILDFRF